MSIERELLDEWLLSDDASKWLDIAAEMTEPAHQQAARLRKDLTADQTHCVLELTDLRRRARRKFTLASQMFFTRTALEQATDQWLASYKAERFADCRNVADLCCGIGGDSIGLAQSTEHLSLFDRSAPLVHFAKANVAVGAADKPVYFAGFDDDVTTIDMSDFDAWHIDPDRRPQGHRTTRTELHDPTDQAIDAMLCANQNGAIKLAPACEVPPRWSDVCELEWISRGGECRQLVAWFGKLANNPGERRASLLTNAGEDYQQIRTIIGSDVIPTPASDEIERFVYEPDAALLASGLVSVLARQHGWWKFSATDGYLTGPSLIHEPAASCFEVQDVVPLNTKKVARYLRERDIGKVEIKQRAVDINPERLRKELKLTGSEQATLLVTRIGESRVAIISNRIINP